IFVIGDLCSLQQDGQPLPGVAQVAMQEGAHAARNVLRAIGREPLERFRYHNYGNMAVIGRGSAVADVGPIKASGFFAWLFWLFLHIFWLIGFRNRITVMTEWAWASLTFHRPVRLIPGENLPSDGSWLDGSDRALLDNSEPSPRTHFLIKSCRLGARCSWAR